VDVRFLNLQAIHQLYDILRLAGTAGHRLVVLAVVGLSSATTRWLRARTGAMPVVNHIRCAVSA
jgi:hypothetical protein